MRNNILRPIVYDVYIMPQRFEIFLKSIALKHGTVVMSAMKCKNTDFHILKYNLYKTDYRTGIMAFLSRLSPRFTI